MQLRNLFNFLKTNVKVLNEDYLLLITGELLIRYCDEEIKHVHIRKFVIQCSTKYVYVCTHKVYYTFYLCDYPHINVNNNYHSISIDFSYWILCFFILILPKKFFYSHLHYLKFFSPIIYSFLVWYYFFFIWWSLFH